MNENLKRLEEKIAHLEHHVTQQDKAMLEMSEDIARLRRELKTLRERATTGTTSGDTETMPDERPPHY